MSAGFSRLTADVTDPVSGGFVVIVLQRKHDRDIVIVIRICGIVIRRNLDLVGNVSVGQVVIHSLDGNRLPAVPVGICESEIVTRFNRAFRRILAGDKHEHVIIRLVGQADAECGLFTFLAGLTAVGIDDESAEDVFNVGQRHIERVDSAVVGIIRNHASQLHREGLIPIQGVIILSLDLHRLVLIPIRSQEAQVVGASIIRSINRNQTFGGIAGSDRQGHSAGWFTVQFDREERNRSGFRSVSADRTDAHTRAVIITVGKRHI